MSYRPRFSAAEAEHKGTPAAGPGMASRIGSLDKTARLWDPATGEHRRTLTGHTNLVFGVAFRPDGRLLATASTDKRRGCGT